MTTHATDLSLGTVVAGRFRIESVLGTGGYGSVFAAIQLNLGRRVALKLLHPHVLARANARARFEREARLAQQLSHPNNVRLFDFGATDEGRAFIVWEMLEGRSLDIEIARGPFTTERAARVASQVLKALSEAHALGIVHRDIKPANIFLCDFAGERDFVKVLDYGIATNTKEEASGLTQEGVVLGTASYMSPEQVSGEPVDPRTDLYAVGLVLGEMLAGEAVFRGVSSLDVAMKQLSPEPVPHADATRCSPLFPLVARATEKIRERRFSSAQEMLAAMNSTHAHAGASSLTSTTGRENSDPIVVIPPKSPERVFDSTALPLPGRAPPHTTSQPFALRTAEQLITQRSALRRWLIGLGALSLLALAVGVFAVLRVTAADDDRAQTTRKAVVVDDADTTAHPELDAERAAFEFLLNAAQNPKKPCRPIDKDLTSWHVHGITLDVLLSRAERGGYACKRHVVVGKRGVYEFQKPGQDREIHMHYEGLVNVMQHAPGSRTITDERSRHSLTVIASDGSAKAASAFAEALAE